MSVCAVFACGDLPFRRIGFVRRLPFMAIAATSLNYRTNIESNEFICYGIFRQMSIVFCTPFYAKVKIKQLYVVVFDQFQLFASHCAIVYDCSFICQFYAE